MIKNNVMVHDVTDVMVAVDEKVEEIRHSGIPLREMTDRQCYEMACARDNVFGNSAFAELPNGRRIFDRVWEAVECNENREVSLDNNIDDSMVGLYRRFCSETESYLDVARMAAELN